MYSLYLAYKRETQTWWVITKRGLSSFFHFYAFLFLPNGFPPETLLNKHSSFFLFCSLPVSAYFPLPCFSQDFGTSLKAMTHNKTLINIVLRVKTISWRQSLPTKWWTFLLNTISSMKGNLNLRKTVQLMYSLHYIALLHVHLVMHGTKSTVCLTTTCLRDLSVCPWAFTSEHRF